MATLSRASLRTVVAVTAAVIALAGCGSTQSPKAATATSGTPSPSASPSASSSATPTGGPTGSPRASAGAQVVEVEKYGVSFELPKSWITLNARKVFKGGAKNPFLAELANRLGTTEQQLVEQFSTVLQTMSVSDAGAAHGFLANVNSVGQEGDVNDEQIKLQLATIGAKPGAFSHATTEAGDLTRIPYDLQPKSVAMTIHAVALAVHTEVATVVITASSSSAKDAAAIADQIQASLKTIPGTGPNA